jgi:predicted RNA-binding protein with TRAM domain
LTSSSTNKYISRTVSTGQTYYIKVTPYSSSGSGTYQIAFNTGGIPPGGVISTALTLNQWANGNLPANGEQWFTFTATAGTQYIHASFDTWDYILTEFYVQVYDSSGAAVGDITYLGYDNRYTSRTVSTEQTYYIKVTPTSRSYSGTYKIAFNTVLFPPGATPTALTLDTWANGNLPANGEQWFTFTATASTQWIHVSLGTLTIFYVQVYDSSGNRVGDDKEFTSSSSSYSISRTVSTGQTYYIRVKIPGALSGTYKIGFNTSNYEPFN